MGITSIRRNLESVRHHSAVAPAADLSPSVLADVVARQNDRIACLQSEVDAARGELAEGRAIRAAGPSESDMRDACAEIEKLRDLLGQSRARMAAMQDEIGQANARTAAIEGELGHATTRIAELEGELEKAKQSAAKPQSKR